MPCASASTCTSMCRPCSTYFSTSIVSSPNARARLAPGGGDAPRRSRPASRTIRMPLPPPPAAALTSTGKPTRRRRRAVDVAAARRTAPPAPRPRRRSRGRRPCGPSLHHLGGRADERRARPPRRPGRTRRARTGSRSRGGSRRRRLRGGRDDGVDVEVGLGDRGSAVVGRRARAARRGRASV